MSNTSVQDVTAENLRIGDILLVGGKEHFQRPITNIMRTTEEVLAFVKGTKSPLTFVRSDLIQIEFNEHRYD